MIWVVRVLLYFANLAKVPIRVPKQRDVNLMGATPAWF